MAVEEVPQVECRFACRLDSNEDDRLHSYLHYRMPLMHSGLSYQQTIDHSGVVAEKMCLTNTEGTVIENRQQVELR